MSQLRDTFGRKFSYLRLSVTDVCNFRCVYCLPNGYQKPNSETNEFLNLSEIENLTRAFAELGTWKIRLTGGEPTLRSDILEIAKTIRAIPGIRWLALSTNGHRLKSLARPFVDAGIDAINVSVDSLDPKRFAEITGMDRLTEILEGIEIALHEGFKRVKLNVVLMEGWNSGELAAFADWVRDRPVSVRFIELMPTRKTTALFTRRHLQSDQIQRALLEKGWHRQPREEGDGPAVEFRHPGYRGSLGLIAPYSSEFCTTCNRLRVTSRGGLRLCLFGEKDHPLREWLASPDQKEELKDSIRATLEKKEISHYLPKGIYGDNRTFSAIGG